MFVGMLQADSSCPAPQTRGVAPPTLASGLEARCCGLGTGPKDPQEALLLVRWRGVLSIGHTALILGLFVLHEKLSSFCCSLQRWLQRMQMAIAVSGIQVSSFRLPPRCWGCLYSPYCR